MEQIGTIETVCRYPVKSMAGEEMAQAFIGFAGLMGDRVYAFVREPGPKGFPWYTGRQQNDLVLYQPRFRDAVAVALPGDIETSLGMAPGANPIFPSLEAFVIDVLTPGGQTWPIDSPDLKAELEKRASQEVSLRFSERSLYDCRPVSLFGNASAEALGQELGMVMDRRRFRANLYIDWNDDQPYRENDLIGRTLQIGERVQLVVTERDSRCQMITIDPATAKTDPRILRHVSQEHDGMAGVYAVVLLDGIVNKGDGIWLL